MDEAQELIKEFLIESGENLARLDQEFVELEQRPGDQGLLSSIFRTIHTIKGTCGFLGFGTLEAVTHRAENLLSQLRDREKTLTPELTTLLLQTVDAVKTILGQIEESGVEGQESYDQLRTRLQAACETPSQSEGPTPPSAPLVLDVGVETEPPAAEEEVAPPEIVAASQVSPASETKIDAPAAEVVDIVHVQTSIAVARSDAPARVANGGVSSSETTEGKDAAGAAKPSIADSTIRVDVNLLDNLMNLAGELVLSRNQILQYATSQENATLTATSQRLNLITTELQSAVMKTRMQPIGVVWNKFPWVVRDLATSVGKQVSLEMEGEGTELDKTLIEAIKDPLTHVVRNSCDHGIEDPTERLQKGKPARGTLRLRAYHEGGQVNIEISDDGAGINPQKIKAKALDMGLLTPDQAERMSDKELCNLVFAPGLSTAKKITNVSGRGVGMDVVRTNIEKIGGSIDLQSWPDQGTSIKIKIPLTLAIIPALMVSCGSEQFAIPQVSLLELVRLEGETTQTAIEWVHGSPVYRLRGKLLPLVYLNKILGIDRPEGTPAASDFTIVVLHADERTFGLVVDGVHDTQEIVVKPLSNLLKGLQCYAGATILGDGNVALILDVFGIAQTGGALSQIREHAQTTQEEKALEVSDRQLFLLFRSGSAERIGVPLSLVGRLEEFRRDQIEVARGRWVTQYRDELLPLVPLAEQLQLGPSSLATDTDRPLPVVVFAAGDRRLGIVVDQIVDVVEDTVRARSPSERPGIVGSGVLAGHATDFLDLRYLIETVEREWFGERLVEKSLGARVMLAEASGFSRAVLRNYLEMNGYGVIEVSSATELFERLERERVELLLVSLDLPGLDPKEMLQRIRQEPNWARLRVVALASHPAETGARAGWEVNFDDYQLKFDREGMLRSIEKLAAALEPAESANAALLEQGS